MPDSPVLPQQQLVAAREQAKWSCEQVACALNLPVKTIELLEAGEFSALHGHIYIVSYLRAYAALFSLDGEALVSTYKQQSAEEQVYIEPAMHSGKLSAKFEHQSNHTLYGVLAAVLIVLVVGLITAKPMLNESPTQLPVLSEVTLETPSGLTTVSALENLPNKNPTADLLPKPDALELKSVPQKVAKLAPMASNIPLDESNLSFQFSADCWVEVYDGDNQKIYSALKKAQQRLELQGKPPFRVTLGYAPGVSLSYNGQPVSIDAENAKYKQLVLGNS